jgi:hypothetical protein
VTSDDETQLVSTVSTSSVSWQGSSSFLEIRDALAKAADYAKAPSVVNLVWDTPAGEAIVCATKMPLGITYANELPIKVTAVDVGHGKEIGIEVGWVLKSVNGKNITDMGSFGEASKALSGEFLRLTAPRQKKTPTEVRHDLVKSVDARAVEDAKLNKDASQTVDALEVLQKQHAWIVEQIDQLHSSLDSLAEVQDNGSVAILRQRIHALSESANRPFSPTMTYPAQLCLQQTLKNQLASVSKEYLTLTAQAREDVI